MVLEFESQRMKTKTSYVLSRQIITVNKDEKCRNIFQWKWGFKKSIYKLWSIKIYDSKLEINQSLPYLSLWLESCTIWPIQRTFHLQKLIACHLKGNPNFPIEKSIKNNRFFSSEKYYLVSKKLSSHELKCTTNKWITRVLNQLDTFIAYHPHISVSLLFKKLELKMIFQKVKK